jgi:hypothetical protein
MSITAQAPAVGAVNAVAIFYLKRKMNTDVLDPNDLTTALSAVALKLRALIFQELTDSPDAYVGVLDEKNVPPDPAIMAMAELVKNIEQGQDITPSFEKIKRLIHNQESRAEVFSSLSLTHEYGRYASFLQARRRVELVLLAIASKGKLTPGDALALLAYLNAGIGKIEQRFESNSTGNRDIAALLGKIDYLVSTQQQEIQKKMANTTPQNREILRRVGHKLLKMAPKPVN